MAEFNPYGNNYATFSQALNQNLQQQADENARLREEQRANERMAMEKERQAQDMAFRQEQIMEMKIKQNEKLMVPPDTGIKPLDAYISQASRQVVDQAAALKEQLSAGEMSEDEFASAYAQIQTQVPQLKNFKETFTENVANYTDALASGTLSNAMLPGTDALYKALANGGGDFTLGYNPEIGEVVMAGTSADGEAVNIPLSGINQMPKPIVKQPAPWETLSPSMTAMAAGTSDFGSNEVQTQVENSFDQIAAQGKSSLMSLAVDWYGMSYEEAEELYMAEQDPDAEESTKLAEALKQKWMDTAQTQFQGKRLEIREQELQNALKQKQLMSQPQAGNMSVAGLKQQAAQTTYQNINNVVQSMAKIQDPQDQVAYLNQNFAGSGITIEYADKPDDRSFMEKWTPNAWGGTSAPEGGEFVMYDSKGNELGFADDPMKLQQMLANQILGADTALQFMNSPVNRNSPLNRGRAASKARENARTKAAHEQGRQERSADLDQQRQDEKVGWGDIAQSAAGALPYVGALASSSKIAKAAAKAYTSKVTGGATGGSVTGGAQNIATGEAKAKAKDIVKKGIKKGLGAVVGSGADVAGAATKAIGIAGTAKAAYDTAKLYNKKMVQDMTPEQYENYKRTGSTSGSRRGKNSRGRRS